MKKIINLFILVLIAYSTNAAILRCNNTPGMQGVYTTFSSAVNAAQSGDTIHIEPSGIDYLETANITINKKLAIFGNGSNLSLYPGLQADTNRARITMSSIALFITFQPGSRGSYISCNYDGGISIRTDSITFDKCYFPGILSLHPSIPNISHVIMKRSYCMVVTKTATGNINFNNCIIFSFNSPGTLPTIGFANLENCIVGPTLNSTLENCLLSNTVITSKNPGASSLFTNCTLNNNIFTSNFEPQGLSATDSLTNQFISQNTVFDPLPSVTNYYEDYHFKFKSTFNPGTVGPYVGNTPYFFGSIPPIPSIYQLTVPAIINSNTGTISISTRSNY
jgi:hypothetical protein